MVQNGIRQEGISVLLRDGLRGCTDLQVLDLQDNTFTFVGALALSNVVGGWMQLTELGVGDCLLGARGAVVVAEALGKRGNAKLRVLRAQYNDIDGKGVKALLGAAKGGLAGLRRVELNGNKFSEDDEAVGELRTLLEGRRDGAGEGQEKDGGEWGLDELSDLEEESEDEEEEDDDDEKPEQVESEEETELKAEAILKEADQAEQSTVSQKKDRDVDALADTLGKTSI